MPLDIVLFGVIALVLIFRLLNTLGKEDKNGGQNNRPLKDIFGAYRKSALMRASKREAQKSQVKAEQSSAAREEPAPSSAPSVSFAPGKAEGALAPLVDVFPDLEEKAFLKGAARAFEIILEAYAKGDDKLLSSLVDSQVFALFRSGIAERKKQGQRLEISLVNCSAKRIVRSALKGEVAHITVEFSSKQCRLLFNADNQLIEGDPSAEDPMIDQWTFQRTLNSQDPTWFLCATTVARKKPSASKSSAAKSSAAKKPSS